MEELHRDLLLFSFMFFYLLRKNKKSHNRLHCGNLAQKSQNNRTSDYIRGKKERKKNLNPALNH